MGSLWSTVDISGRPFFRRKEDAYDSHAYISRRGIVILSRRSVPLAVLRIQFYHGSLFIWGAFSSFFDRIRKLAQYFGREHRGFACADRESGHSQY